MKKFLIYILTFILMVSVAFDGHISIQADEGEEDTIELQEIVDETSQEETSDTDIVEEEIVEEEIVEPEEIAGDSIENPILITTEEQFIDCMISSQENTYYRLENDLDFCMYENIMIPTFKGYLDGNHKTITNFYTTARGLVSKVCKNATIKDLVIKNIFVENEEPYSVGGVCGSLYGTLENVNVKSGDVSALGQGEKVLGAGGLVGRVYDGANIIDCGSSAIVACGAYNGGLIGIYSGKAIVRDSFARGKVFLGTKRASGFIAGCVNADTSSIIGCVYDMGRTGCSYGYKATNIKNINGFKVYSSYKITSRYGKTFIKTTSSDKLSATISVAGPNIASYDATTNLMHGVKNGTTSASVKILVGSHTLTKTAGTITVNLGTAVKIHKVWVSKCDASGYTVKAIVENATSVKMRSWTKKNGKDDLTIQDATLTKNSDGTYTARVRINTTRHKNEVGIYYTHVYAYKKGKTTKIYKNLGPVKVENKAPVMQSVTVSNKGYYSYKVTAKMSDDGAIKRVRFLTYTKENGKDDAKWTNAVLTKTSTGYSATATIEYINHNNEEGIYKTIAYAYDDGGLCSTKGAGDIEVDIWTPRVKSVKTSNASGDMFMVTAVFKSRSEINDSTIRAWTEAGGKDDIFESKGTIRKTSGNTYEVSCAVKRSDHNKEYGTYKVNVSAKNKKKRSKTTKTLSQVVLSYDSDDWTIIDGKKYYFNKYHQMIGNGQETLRIIDVSSWQGKIDWAKVKKDGVDGAILRCGYGTVAEDDYFAYNLEQCEKYDIPYGIYLFSYAINVAQSTSEANWTKTLLKKYNAKPTLPIFYDLENFEYYMNGKLYDSSSISTSTYRSMIAAYIKTLNGAGYKNVQAYSYYNMLLNKLNDPDIWKHVGWVAHYGAYELDSLWTNPYYTGMLGWQYTSSATCPGINGRVDESIFYYK